MNCPCGNPKPYSQCCEPYISGKKPAPDPESLMRSRYTAYVKSEIEYLKETLSPDSRKDFDTGLAKEWAEQSEWLSLTINSVKGNVVDFTAKYRSKDKVLEHHEVSKFKKIGEKWFFVSGESHVHEEGEAHHEPIKPIEREGEKLGRNDPCKCGSGKKFKKCCG